MIFKQTDVFVLKFRILFAIWNILNKLLDWSRIKIFFFSILTGYETVFFMLSKHEQRKKNANMKFKFHFLFSSYDNKRRFKFTWRSEIKQIKHITHYRAAKNEVFINISQNDLIFVLRETISTTAVEFFSILYQKKRLERMLFPLTNCRELAI